MKKMRKIQFKNLDTELDVKETSGLMRSVTESGAYFGSPAKEHRTALRMEAALRRLPDLLREFAELKRLVGSQQTTEEDTGS